MKGVHAARFVRPKWGANKQRVASHIDRHSEAISRHRVGARGELLGLTKNAGLPLEDPHGPRMVIRVVDIHAPGSNGDTVAGNGDVPPEVVRLQLAAWDQHRI